MGEIVGKYADTIILTHEDSRTEKPMDIINMIKTGVEQSGKQLNRDYFIIEDRHQAIHQAISLAQPNDIVVFTGKGAETKMYYPDKTIEWHEKNIIEDLIHKIVFNKT
jgi:UDP-N-acetylmuramoyl-L-alanyl-D-glutamate--2,6-diaminopimelate ligase